MIQCWHIHATGVGIKLSKSSWSAVGAQFGSVACVFQTEMEKTLKMRRKTALCGFAPNAEVAVGQAVITGKNLSVCGDSF